MQKTFTLLATLFFGLSVVAQVDIHLDNDPGTNYNGQTVDITINSTNNYTLYMHAVNTTAGTFDYNFRRVIISSNATFSDQFCDNNLCYAVSGNDWTTPSSNSIVAGDSCIMKPLYDFTSAGSVLLRYYVLDASNGDAILDSVDVNITSTLAIEDAENIELSAYPNPATENLFVEFQGVSGNDYQLAIYNVLGEEVRKVKLTDGLNEIAVGDLTDGVYFYSVLNKSKVIETKKLVVR